MKINDRRLSVFGMAALGLAVLLGGCDTDSLVQVPDPDVVSQPVFADPDNLDAVLAGVRREWARAYGGEQNDEGGQIHQSATFADEMHHSGTFTTRQEIDAREITLTNGSNEEAFFELQRARNHAELAAGLFADSDRSGSAGHAEVLTLAGFSYILFAENYCSGVPFSVLPLEGEEVFGAPETTGQILDRALDRLSAADGLAGATGDLASAIAVARGRALLNADEPAAAAQAVASVPTGFVYATTYDAAAQSTHNAVYQLTNAEKRWSVTGNEGTNGLPLIFDDDPRISAAEVAGEGFQAGVIHFEQFKYPGVGTDIALATGIEARLIEAEAALRAGERDEFFAIHNTLRALEDGLADLEDTGQSEEELVTLHFTERAAWLWLTSHRLGDLRRLVRQYGRAAGDVYPVGSTVQNSPYGPMLSMPVPFTEENNPNYDPMQCTPNEA